MKRIVSKEAVFCDGGQFCPMPENNLVQEGFYYEVTFIVTDPGSPFVNDGPKQFCESCIGNTVSISMRHKK